jgi:hypothetical protein
VEVEEVEVEVSFECLERDRATLSNDEQRRGTARGGEQSRGESRETRESRAIGPVSLSTHTRTHTHTRKMTFSNAYGPTASTLPFSNSSKAANASNLSNALQASRELHSLHLRPLLLASARLCPPLPSSAGPRYLHWPLLTHATPAGPRVHPTRPH